MTGPILVAYATKYGATKEIAEVIAETLNAAGRKTELRIARQVESVVGYAAVVLGSAVYVGQWQKEAVALLEAQEAALAELPVWLFSSGPTGKGDPVALMSGWRLPVTVAPIADRIGVRDRALFHGHLDPGKLSLPEKLIIKGVKAPLGDFRDWDSVRAWARSIDEALTHENV